MSHRHSCDRCRQQKVRCLRDESHGGGSNPASPGRTSFSRCERCTKAGVDCVYSLKQKTHRPFVQPAARRDTTAEPNSLSGVWFGHGLGGVFCQGEPAVADFADLPGPFPGVGERGPVAGFNGGWDANLQLFSPISPLTALPAPSSGADAAAARDVRAISAAPSTTDDGEDDEDPADAQSSQLMALSQRATRAMRRLVRPGRAPPTVSSPEVNEAFEDTNTLIRIINHITAASSDHDDVTTDPTTTDHGLVFLALASHQHLVALFRAICDAIHQCLESMASGNENQQQQQQQQQQRSLHYGDVGPSSVAQFVMVLQLLMHLINRMDRSLFPVNKPGGDSSESSTGSQATPITPNTGHHYTIHPLLIEAGVRSKAGGGSPPQGGLPALAQGIVRAIPDEHEKLRQVIQGLQTKMEHSELH